MKHKLKLKAYEINLSLIDEGYSYSKLYCFGETRGKAKSELLNIGLFENCKLRFCNDDLTYLNIPVIRCKEYDKFEFEGEDLTKYEIQKKIDARERNQSFDDMLNDTTITHCYIRKGSYYRPGSSGYTDFRHRAGVFTKQEAISSAKSCGDLSLIPIDILEHNKLIYNEINDLQSRILN